MSDEGYGVLPVCLEERKMPYIFCIFGLFVLRGLDNNGDVMGFSNVIIALAFVPLPWTLYFIVSLECHRNLR